MKTKTYTSNLNNFKESCASEWCVSGAYESPNFSRMGPRSCLSKLDCDSQWPQNLEAARSEFSVLEVAPTGLAPPYKDAPWPQLFMSWAEIHPLSVELFCAHEEFLFQCRI